MAAHRTEGISIIAHHRRLARLLAAALLLGAGTPAAATTFARQDFVCPAGGEKFTANVIVSFTSWGQRPDGRPYGTLPIYPITECPGNGLLLVQDNFSPEDVAKLGPLVASSEYQAMRTAETPHYRAWWLLAHLQRDPYTLASFLLQASWETDADLARKARYQAAFVAAATGLKPAPDKTEAWFVLNMRAGNALRELGYFDKAAQLLARVDKPEFMPKDAATAAALRALIARLQVLIAEGNPTPEPANLIPRFEAARRCEIGAAFLSPSEVAACDDPQLAEPRKQMRKALDRESRHKPKRG